ncbi:MAG TPA: hypothetical protein VIQ53_01480, partial [Inquilinus sp.]
MSISAVSSCRGRVETAGLFRCAVTIHRDGTPRARPVAIDPITIAVPIAMSNNAAPDSLRRTRSRLPVIAIFDVVFSGTGPNLLIMKALRILALIAAVLATPYGTLSAADAPIRLDALLDQLRTAEDLGEAQRLERQIWTLWLTYEGADPLVPDLL